MKILFATKNPGKIKEIKKILEPPQFEILSLDDAGINVDIIEDGNTFEENAVKKAVGIAKFIREKPMFTDMMVMADDSGLEIDCLDKAPGVYSARYLGNDTPYDVKNKMILDMIKDVSGKDRSARFVCVIACVTGYVCDAEVNVPTTNAPSKNFITARAVLEGVIAKEARGSGGFGYDPIFCPIYMNDSQKTLAEFDISDKNKISHRGKALKAIKDKLCDGGFL